MRERDRAQKIGRYTVLRTGRQAGRQAQVDACIRRDYMKKKRGKSFNLAPVFWLLVSMPGNNIILV